MEVIKYRTVSEDGGKEKINGREVLLKADDTAEMVVMRKSGHQGWVRVSFLRLHWGDPKVVVEGNILSREGNEQGQWLIPINSRRRGSLRISPNEILRLRLGDNRKTDS